MLQRSGQLRLIKIADLEICRNAVGVLILDPLRGIPATRAGRFICAAQMILDLLPGLAGPESSRNWKRKNTGRNEKEDIALVVTNDPGGEVAILAVQTFEPQIGRFRHVGVGRNDVEDSMM